MLAQHVGGDAMRLVRGRYATIEREQQQHLLDLLRRAAVLQRAAQVHAELVGVAPAIIATITSDFISAGSAVRCQTSP